MMKLQEIKELCEKYEKAIDPHTQYIDDYKTMVRAEQNNAKYEEIVAHARKVIVLIEIANKHFKDTFLGYEKGVFTFVDTDGGSYEIIMKEMYWLTQEALLNNLLGEPIQSPSEYRKAQLAQMKKDLDSRRIVGIRER